jgi:WD40 repeat protein
LTAVVAAARASGPYKGLTYFTEADAAFFFGREAERDLIIADLKASSLSLVYGQSGVGKSSLLRAGVAAAAREEARSDFARFGNAEFVPVVFANWRDDPLEGLARAIGAAAEEFAVPGEGPPVAAGSLVEVIEAAAKRTQASILVVLDQFEEYFLYHRSDRGPQAFSEQFAEAVNKAGLPAGFLVAMRDDALAQLDVFRGRIPKLFSSYRRVHPLSKKAAKQAIVRPIEEYNRLVGTGEQISVEDELVTAVVSQVASGQVKLDSVGAGALDGAGQDAVEAPYLQLVMSRLWQEETDQGSRTLRLSTLEALGGAQKIVRGHLDATLGALAEGDQEVAADVFHHLVTPSGTKIAHAVADLVDYTGWPEEKVATVLERLGEGGTRIVRPVQPPAGQEGPPRYEIFHDVLAPAVLDWRGRHEKEAAQREKEAAERRASLQRRRAMVAWAAAALAIALLAAFLVGNYVSQQDNNRSRVLASYAVANLDSDPQLSAMLAISAMRKSATSQAQSALREAYPLIEEERSLPVGKEISATAFSPDGQQVAAGTTGSGTVVVFGSGHWRSPVRLRTLFLAVNALAFSPDGRYIAVVGDVPHKKPWGPRHWPGAEILSVSGQRPARVLFVPDADVVSQWGHGVAWSGPYLVTADDGGYLCLYEPAAKPTAGRCAASLLGGGLASVSLDRDGSLAAVSNSAGAALYSVPSLRDYVVSGNEVWGLGDIEDAVLSPSGAELATTSSEGITMVYGVRKGVPVLAKVATSAEVLAAAFSPDGTELATTTDLGQTTVWQLAPQSPSGAVQVTQDNCDCGVVYTIAFDPTGAPELVTGSSDGVVRLWGTRPTGLLAEYTVSNSFPFFGFPDGISALYWVPALDDVVALMSGPLVTGEGQRPDRAVVLDLRSGRSSALSSGSGVLDVGSVAASPSRSGSLVLAVTYTGNSSRLQAWDLANKGGVPTLTATDVHLPSAWPALPKGAQPNSVELSPNGEWAVVTFSYSDGSEVDPVEVANLGTGRAAVLPRTPHYSYSVNDMAFDATSRRVVVAYNNGVAWDWSLSGRTPRYLGQFADPAPNAVLWAARYSPDGAHMVLADNFGNLTIFDAATHREAEAPLNAGGGQVNMAVFSGDGKEVLTSGDDGTVRVWDVVTGSQLSVAGPYDVPDPTAVNSAVFGTFDGRTVIILGSNDGVVRVWSAAAATPDLHALERLTEERLEGRCYTPAELREFGSPAQVFSKCGG